MRILPSFSGVNTIVCWHNLEFNQRLGENYTTKLRAVLNKSLKQQPKNII